MRCDLYRLERRANFRRTLQDDGVLRRISLKLDGLARPGVGVGLTGGDALDARPRLEHDLAAGGQLLRRYFCAAECVNDADDVGLRRDRQLETAVRRGALEHRIAGPGR